MNVPKLRFKDNNDNDYPQWEKKKLGDTLLIQRGGSPRPISDYITNDKNGLNWIKIGDCPSNSNIITSTKEKIKPEGLSKTREVFVGDLILSNSMSFGRPYILNINGCIHDGWLLLRDTQKIYNLQFLCYILGSEYITKQYKKLASGSTVNNLNKDLVGSVIINIPQLEEQTKIVNFLSTVDKKISNIEDIITNLEKQKKGLLQQIFSQKIRFKDKNGNNYPDWEKKKLNELCFKIGDGLHATPKYIDSGTNYFINGNNLLNKKIIVNELTKKVSTNELSKYYISLGNNSILISINGTIGNLAFYNNENIILGKSCGYINLKDDVIKDFIYYYLLQSKIQLYFHKELTGTTIKNLSLVSLKNTPIKLPCLEEQTKIADFLSAFDRKINNQKAQLEHWKQIKKGLLQQMFV